MSSADIIGKGWGFPPDFASVSSGPSMSTEEALINQSIYLILNTRFGERPLHPTFGSNVSDFLFNSVDPGVLADLKEEIANSIMLSEPRITLDTIQFDSTQIYDGRLNIHLSYAIDRTHALGSYVFPYYLSDR